MASYTRQSTFSDGDLITAALFNDEYNQLLAAFENTTGHKHDGTVGEGPVIGILGDAGVVTPLNKILIDTTNDSGEAFLPNSTLYAATRTEMDSFDLALHWLSKILEQIKKFKRNK